MRWPWGETGRRYLGDLVYGANDGIITTFAVAAGVAGASLQPRIVLVLGLANLVADGFSMAASNFLSIRSRNAIAAADGHSPEPEPIRHAAATFLAFVTAGAVPLLAYVLPIADARFVVAIAFTGVTLFGVGAARSLVTAAAYFRSGAEMLLVGAAAAAVSYGIGRLLGPLARG